MVSEEQVQQIMNDIEMFYFSDGDDSGEAIFNRFAEKHHESFEEGCDATQMENKLEYTQIYKEYQDLFESKIEEIIKRAAVDPEEFLKMMNEKSKTDEQAEMFLQILLSCTDFTNFVEMMRSYKKSTSNPVKTIDWFRVLRDSELQSVYAMEGKIDLIFFMSNYE